MKKIFIIVTLAIFLIAGISVISFKANNKPQKDIKPPQTLPLKIKIAYLTNNKIYAIPLMVAEEKGIFKKYNLEVNAQSSQTGVSKLLAGNQVDAILNIPTPLSAIEGAKVSWVGTFYNDSPNILISYRKPQDIEIVSFVSAGSILGKIRTEQALQALGLKSDDINLRSVSSDQAAFTALMGRKVDAIANVKKSDWLIFAKRNKLSTDEFKILVGSDENKNLRMGGGMIARNELLEKNKSTIENFAKAFIEAVFWARSNKNLAIEILEKKLEITKDEAGFYYDEFDSISGNITFAPNNEQGLEMLKIIEEANPKAKDYKIENYLYYGISDSLKKSGFLDKFGYK